MKISRSALEAWRDFELDQHELIQEMIACEVNLLEDYEESALDEFWQEIRDRGRDEDYLDADDFRDLHAWYECEDYYP